MKKSLKSFISDNKFILITGAISTFVILFVYASLSIVPFGENSIYRHDLYFQYGPLFSELYDRITSGESLIYSWNTGLGGYFLGNFFNYLSSPLNFLIFLFKRENVCDAVALMIALKAVLSSISMAYYLKKSQKSNNISIVVFGLMYTFCAYFVAYYWNLMWLDAMYFLPLIILGIEKIIDNGKCMNYIVCLSLAIYSNYYIGFMLCIFSCVYFIYYYACSADKFKQTESHITEKLTFIQKIKKSQFIKCGIKFACSSLLVGGILSVMLIAVAKALSHSSATSGGEIPPFEIYFNIYDFLANHLASLQVYALGFSRYSLPNVYCGILTIILIPIYLMSKEIKKSEKIASVSILVFMFLSFTTNYANGLWHGYHFPNGLPFRQSFMYSFLLILLAFKTLKIIDKISKKQILISGIGVIFFIVAVWIIGSQNVEGATIIISLAFSLIYTVFLALINNKKNSKMAVSIILVVLVVAEILVANTGHYSASVTKSELTSDYEDLETIQNQIDTQDGLLFFREELTNNIYPMSSCWYDLDGISVFSSMTYQTVSSMQKALGLYSNNINRAVYNPQTPVYNAMFSLKYLYDKDDYPINGDYYTSKMISGPFTTYQNNYVLNIAYPVSETLAKWNANDYANPVEAQQEYFWQATGIDNVYTYITDYEIIYENVVPLDNANDLKSAGKFNFEKKSATDSSVVSMQITAGTDENIYVYVKSKEIEQVHIDSPEMKMQMKVDLGCIFDLGEYDAGEIINANFIFPDDVTSADVDFIAFTVNKDAFVAGYKLLKKGQLEYTEFDETVIKGNFVAEENEILYTSIPYDKAWNIYIDGEKVADENIIAISDALIGVKSISAGKHDIVFEYKNIGLLECLIIPIFVIVFSIGLHIINRFILRKKKDISVESTEAK